MSETKAPGFRIIGLREEGFKRISLIDITPPRHMVKITGRNEQGKSSLLDGIAAALDGGAEFLQAKPIKVGRDKAVLRVTIGNDEKVEMIVTKTIRRKEDGTEVPTLVVENAEGFRAPQPQTMLKAFLGPLTFDPGKFMLMRPEAQFDQISGMVPGVDFKDMAAKNVSDYDKRTDINRDAKRARSAAEAIEVPDSIDAQTAAVDEAALTEELAGAGAQNARIEARLARRADVRLKIAQAPEEQKKLETDANAALKVNMDRAEARSKEIEAEIARLKTQLNAVNQAAELEQNEIAAACSIAISESRKQTTAMQEALDKAEELPSPTDTAVLTARITEARQTNAAIRLRDQRKALMDEAESLEATSDKLTEAMEARDKAKEEAIAAAKLPVPGLSLGQNAKGDGIVVLDGLPLSQASRSRKLRVSALIAMSLNPKLSIMLIQDAAFLDEDSLETLSTMAIEHDFQIWTELVDSSGKVGFVIEDGHIAGEVPPEPEPEEAKQAKAPRGGRAKPVKLGEKLL